MLAVLLVELVAHFPAVVKVSLLCSWVDNIPIALYRVVQQPKALLFYEVFGVLETFFVNLSGNGLVSSFFGGA